ncbi:MAG: hypothetical protein U0Q10_00025 [Dermatophilaceae bacterium]
MLDQAIGLLESTDPPEKSLTAMAYAFRSVGRAWSGLRADALSDLSSATAAAQAAGYPWVDANVRQLGMAIDSTDVTSPDATDGFIEVAETFTALGDAHAAVVTLQFALGLSRVRANGRVQELQRRLLACAKGDASPVTAALMAQEVARTTAEQGGNLLLTTELADALAVLERSGNHRTAAVIRRDIGLAMLDRDERAVAELILREASARLGHFDPGSAALAAAGLASLHPGSSLAAQLAGLAWACAESGQGVPPTPTTRERLTTLIGPPPATLPEPASAGEALRALLHAP